MRASEADIQRLIMLEAAQQGFTLWRNNVGAGYTGKSIWVQRRAVAVLDRGDVVIRKARKIDYGLCVGSSDLIGLQPIRIMPHHVGDTFARFVAIEVKSERGKPTPEQRNFIEFVDENGGMAIIARSPEAIKNAPPGKRGALKG